VYPQGVAVDPPVLEGFRTEGGDLIGNAIRNDPLELAKSIMQGDSELAGRMVVAGPGLPEPIGNADRRRIRLTRKPKKALDRGCDQLAGEAIVAVLAARKADDEPRCFEAREVAARR
jgi:hypothetical protein